MREIICTGGAVLVDDEDYERVSQHTWTIDRNGYAVRMIQVEGPPIRKRKKILLHRFLLGAEPGTFVDHIDRNRLDNRRCNLRYATRQQNNINRASIGGASKFKGVYYDKKKKRWCASITNKRLPKRLGMFKNEEDAARAYDKAAFAKWGEFAYLNFPEEIAK